MTAVPLRIIDDIGTRKLTSAAAKDLMEDHSIHYTVRNIPRLTVSKQLRKPPTQHDPSKNYQFRYRAKTAQHPASRREVLGWALQRDAPVHPP